MAGGVTQGAPSWDHCSLTYLSVDLDTGIEYNLSKFVDDTKKNVAVRTIEGRDAI